MNLVLLGARAPARNAGGADHRDVGSRAHIDRRHPAQGRADSTPLGLEAKRYMDSGELVPDEVVIGLVKERLQQPDTENGFISTGSLVRSSRPRSRQGARVSWQAHRRAVAIVVDPRSSSPLTSRRTCRACGKITTASALVGGACPSCGGEAYQRDDDNEATVRNRLESTSAPPRRWWTTTGRRASLPR